MGVNCCKGSRYPSTAQLLYTDSTVLMSNDKDELAANVQVMGKVFAALALRINASKTEIMSILRVKRRTGRTRAQQLQQQQTLN
jgi:hypothetical protein